MMDKMNYWFTGLLTIVGFYFCTVKSEEGCSKKCPSPGKDSAMVCGFAAEGTIYKMFPSACAMDRHSKCYDIAFKETPIEFCIKEHNKQMTRRVYGESCPVFCPNHYRPVCGASKARSYRYRTFNNGCYMDMINCRGEDEDAGYVEVPLEFCPNHLMKNIFKEKLIFSGLKDYRDYA